MSDNNVISIFDRLSKSGEKTNDAPDIVLEPYRAATLERAGRRALSLRVHYSNGDIEQLNYSHRKYDLSTKPERLYISFSTGVVLMDGTNLRMLLDDLQDERIRSLQPFDPARHLSPKEGQPVILAIEWKSSSALKQQNAQPAE